jgi:hypothetical protein
MGSDLYMNPPREKPKYCSTCRFWDPSFNPETDWRDKKAALKDQLDSPEKEQFAYKRMARIETEYGLCRGLNKNLTPDAIRQAPKAIGEIFTLRSFGCNMWQPKPGESEYY